MKISVCIRGAQESQMSLRSGQSLHLTQLFQYASQCSELLISRQSTQNGICPCTFTRREKGFPSFQPLSRSSREVPLASPCTCKTEQLEGEEDRGRKLARRNRDLQGLKSPFIFLSLYASARPGQTGHGAAGANSSHIPKLIVLRFISLMFGDHVFSV